MRGNERNKSPLDYDEFGSDNFRRLSPIKLRAIQYANTARLNSALQYLAAGQNRLVVPIGAGQGLRQPLKQQI
jgi:hypothetical protein